VTPAQRLEILQGYWDAGQNVTSGPSYDDAMMHAGLTNVTAHVWNWPISQQDDLRAFRDTHYSVAKIVFRYTGLVPSNTPIQVGIHDEWGCINLKARGVLNPTLLQCSVVRDIPYSIHPVVTAGLKIVRVGWGYGNGDGTMPGPAHIAAHVQALADTIKISQDVDCFQVWNEPNNLAEHPPGFTLTVDYVINWYNELCELLTLTEIAKLAPPVIDPYFGPGDDNGVWTSRLLNEITGAGYLISHGGKSQTNNPDDIRSWAQFTHDPLKWQYTNSRTAERFLEQVPLRFVHLPVILGEVNAQHIDTPGGPTGWVYGNAAWVHEFMSYVNEVNRRYSQPITHVVFYRWDHDNWRLRDKPKILDAIIEHAI
jgi:hypothetical protein